MCLDTITERRTPNNEVVKAWKLMLVGKTTIQAQYYRSHPFVKGEDFRVAKEEELLTNYESLHYISGFHAYQTKEDAICDNHLSLYAVDTLRAVPVELRGVHTIGRQNGRKVLVAREMRIV